MFLLSLRTDEREELILSRVLLSRSLKNWTVLENRAIIIFSINPQHKVGG